MVVGSQVVVADDGGQPVAVVVPQHAGGQLHLADARCGDLGCGHAQCLREK